MFLRESAEPDVPGVAIGRNRFVRQKGLDIRCHFQGRLVTLEGIALQGFHRHGFDALGNRRIVCAHWLDLAGNDVVQHVPQSSFGDRALTAQNFVEDRSQSINV